jgi:hypothetical protein
MAAQTLQQAKMDGMRVAVVDGYTVVLDRQQQYYEISFAGWHVATRTTYFGALNKIAACQSELRGIAQWIRSEMAP